MADIHAPRNRTPLRNGLSQKHPRAFPDTATQFPKQWAVIREITPENLGDAEDKMTMGDLLESVAVPVYRPNLLFPANKAL
jgi:hypothetical protein